ncbi:AfsR/SARP family transcriptional regulator [Streptomyces xylophagus]|uniref:AfsR/SARP family transcriptional regulator n=1 Tax=Streptomyces xylophagus TaxID=285514 RepID=UPI00068C797C|nr:BTAD domain-containing putative transcriptional regulator [Streptomyces xylophagus]
MTVHLTVLGSIESHIDGRPAQLGHTRQRSVLGALLVDTGQPVTTGQLAERVWGEEQPRQARATLHGYVSRLRRALSDTAEVAIARQGGGYVLALADTATVDVHDFRRLVAQARETDDRCAMALLEDALARWCGEAFGSLDTPWFNSVRDSLDQERFAAQLDLDDLRLRLGRHSEALPGLRARAAAHPLDERLAGQVMLALYGSGRAAEALAHYQRVRHRLADELGIEPGPALRQIQATVLDPAPAPPVSRPPAPGPDRSVRAPAALAAENPAALPRRASTPLERTGSPPAQLPAPIAAFTGRHGELAQLDELVGTAGITALAGTAGVGKTTLAVYWAHRTRHAFPDGQLYANLRGFDPTASATTPAEAIRGFLVALGVQPDRIPAGLEQQTGLYRSLLAGQKVLVLLDNARDAEQVRPLLPGVPGTFTLVTSRNRLTSLAVAEGAQLLTVDPLTSGQARALLMARLGGSRIAAEPAAVQEITARCAGLPFALAVVAARAAAQPRFPLALLAEELRADGARLDALDAGDPATQVRAVFFWSYRALDADTARMFRLLGLHPGPDLAVPAAAALAGVPAPVARARLADLTRAHLLTEHRPGRYTWHDLLRAYAAELAHAQDTDRERATLRMLDHYRRTARRADALLTPRPAPAQATAEQLADHQDALDWFTAEYPVLLALVAQAPAPGSWELASTLITFLDRNGHWQALATAQTTALEAARRHRNKAARADAHRGLGLALERLEHHARAHTHYHRALALYGELDSHPGRARVHQHLSRLFESEGRHRRALTHARSSLDHYRADSDIAGQSAALNNIGWVLAQLGHHSRALTHCRESLTLAEKAGDLNGQAHIHDSLGYVHLRLGEYGEAAAQYRRAVALFRQTGDRLSAARGLARLGDTCQAGAQPGAAHDARVHALALTDQLGLHDTDPLRAGILNSLDLHTVSERPNGKSP